MAILDPIRATILATRVIPGWTAGSRRSSTSPTTSAASPSSPQIWTTSSTPRSTRRRKSGLLGGLRPVLLRRLRARQWPAVREIIGVLAAPDPEEARAGLAACVDYAQTKAWFESANEEGTHAFFAHPIARTGSFLSREAGVPLGTSLGYVIAPPLEAAFALDAALKAAEVDLAVWFAPPSETNFSGATSSASRARSSRRPRPSAMPSCPSPPHRGRAEMAELDADLVSIQEARSLAVAAKAAQKQFAGRRPGPGRPDLPGHGRRDHAGLGKAGPAGPRRDRLRRHGAQDPEDRVRRQGVWDSIKDTPTVGVLRRDEARGIIEIGWPVGVVVG